jgi:hypothetical protein
MDRDPERIIEILSGRSSMFNDEKDEYDKEVVPPTPLPFDKVMKGHPRTSKALLFTCPDEIISEILSRVDDSSLASLAQVDRDCRQLARSRQFSNIVLDYSDNVFQLLYTLLAEAVQRCQNKARLATQPSIGACVRRITVSSNAKWFAHHHEIDDSPNFHSLDKEVKMMRYRDASARYYDSYLHAIETLLEFRFALPHLELLDWRDSALLSPKNFNFNCFHKSKVQHLKLCEILLSKDDELEPPDSSNPWPIRSLHLDVWRDYDVMDENAQTSTSLFCSSLLRQCAPSIETLVWYGHTGTDHLNAPDAQSFGADTSSVPKFPKLRKLHLYSGVHCDSSIFDALLKPPLTSLKIQFYRCSDLEQSLRKRGCIDKLKTFVWDFLRIVPSDPDDPSDDVLEFLGQNIQLSQFALRYGEYHVPNTVLEHKILPLLAKSFLALSSLSLDWREDDIPESALEIISTLKSLKQLSLSAGREQGWSRFTWLIDHSVMQKHLAKLPGLQKVAFSRDSYLDPLFVRELANSLMDRLSPFVPRDPDLEYDRNKARWETKHRRAMVDRGKEYIDVLPNLVWIFLGGHPIHVETCSDDHWLYPGARVVNADLLFEKMDPCFSLLRRIFEGDGLKKKGEGEEEGD